MINEAAGFIALFMIAFAIFSIGKRASTGIAKKAGGGLLGAFLAYQAIKVLNQSDGENENEGEQQNDTQNNLGGAAVNGEYDPDKDEGNRVI